MHFSLDMKHAISSRWLANPNCGCIYIQTDQDHQQKSGGQEELEDTVQDQIRAKDHEISELKEEIRGVENIANASETKVEKEGWTNN